MDGILLIDKPAGKTSHDVVAAVRRELAGGGSGTPARSTRSRRACCSSSSGARDAHPALPHGAAEVLRDRRAARRDSTTGDPEGEIVETGRVPPDPLDAADRRAPPAPARLQRGARSTASAPTSARGPGRRSRARARPVTVYRFEQLWREGDRAAFAIECSAGTYVRTLIADLGDAYCTELRRTRDRAVSTSTTPTRHGSSRWPTR